MKLVKQEDRHGCGVACFAMIAGVTYQQALGCFGGRSFARSGMGRRILEAVLVDQGFAIARVPGQHQLVSRVNLVEIGRQHGRNWHWVVVTNGRIYDPQLRAPLPLTVRHEVPSGYRVLAVTGVVRCSRI